MWRVQSQLQQFSTSTMVLFKMSVIKAFTCGHTLRAVRCLLFVDAYAWQGNWLPRLVLLQVLRCQRPAHSGLCNEARRRALRYGAASNGSPSRSSERRLVARKGSASPTSGCRPDVILFHHRAGRARLAKAGRWGWNRTSIRAFKGRGGRVQTLLRLDDPPMNWWSRR